MPFIEDILKHKSLSIVGLEKNTGKTECLNYVLTRLKGCKVKVALTSIGIDGETRDQVCQTPKPEVTVYEGMVFVTTEKHYKQKRLISEILDVSTRSTSLGRLVTARAKSSGKVLISGAPDTSGLKQMIDKMSQNGIDLTIVDGALSRISLASPAITDAMILATGAAVSGNIPQLVRQTKYLFDLINITEAEPIVKAQFSGIEKGIWAIDALGNLHDLGIASAYMLENATEDLFRFGTTIVATGAITDKLLSHLKSQKNIKEITLIARDFTRIFATPNVYHTFIKKGGTIKVLQKTELIAVCINPTSPEGFVLDSEILRREMEQALQIPVYDVRRI
jgi:molybdopterin-guanine dinucleotide biosynthesis protein